jgi:dTDP-4-amino-4,6-dideoxygalactose transaminase
MIKEIGSEFWEVDISCGSELVMDKQHQYLLTGRTALDFIIRDIKATREFKSVYMPSYCCHTMIQPFLENGVDVEFYDICFENGKYTYEINFDNRCDVILIMQYFGFHNATVEHAINRLKASGKIIVEDSTHSWYSENPYCDKSDYIFASFRKWTGLPCGAVALKQFGDFSIQVPNGTNTKYIELRQQAANLKKQYIERHIGQKEVFLRCYSQAEEMLEIDYENYNMPSYFEEFISRLDVRKIKQKRKSNAKYLNEKLKYCIGIKTIIQNDKDVPLFVPIIVLNEKRDKLRQYLIANEVYCPVHWPLSKEHKINNTYLYDNSLSIVCDQRYSLIDMERIIKLINAFYGG